jgi:hypothetical protein
MGRQGRVLASVALSALVVVGCAGRVEIPERRVLALPRATELARSRGAYERAAKRWGRIERGMAPAEVERRMEAFVAVEEREGADGKPYEHRATVVEGLLCKRTVSETEERWLFGYDVDQVVLVGFAIELERADADDEWRVRRVDTLPADECGEGVDHGRR